MAVTKEREDRYICGIVSVASLKGYPVNKLVRKQFEAQKHRGLEGFGVFDYQEKNLIRSTTERGIKKWLKRYPSSNILFHHRLPTSTDNVKNACHPFSTKDFFRTNYVLVHNGHISNASALKTEHEKLGIVYHSVQPDGAFNDSEALLWDVALYLEGKQTELKSQGGVAFVCMAIGKGNKHDRLYFGRNYYPLKMKLNEHILMLSSEGEGDLIEPHTLYNYNYVNNKLTSKELDIDRWKYVQPLRPYGEPSEDYETTGVRPTATSAIRLIKTAKDDLKDRQKDVNSLIDRLMWQNEGWFYDVETDMDYEYDCLSLLHDQWQELGYTLRGVNYTLGLYETAIDQLEDMQARLDDFQDLTYSWDGQLTLEGETA